MKAIILVSRGIRYMRIFVWLSHGGASNDNVIVEQSNFHRLLLAINYYVRKLYSICRTYMHERDYVSKTAAHSDFSVYRRHRNLLAYSLTFAYDIQPFGGFSAILKCMTLNEP